MKKFFSLMIAAFGLLLLVGCADSPKEVAKKWTSAVIEGNIEEANEYSTERTHALNGLVIAMIKSDDNPNQKQMKENLDKGLAEIDSYREEIKGDSAKLYKDANDKNPMTLKKVDGEWKVDVEK